MIEQANAAGAALSAFGLGSQHHRLLRMEFPRKDGPGAMLLVNTLQGREELSRCFRFEVELLSDDAGISLKAMMARMVTISLVRDDGSLRYFNGYVSEFRFMRTDGGFAFYRMILEPWLAFAKLRTDCVSFQDKSVLEITEQTFARYQQQDWKPMLCEKPKRITCANQHNETDYNHLHRRWEAAGLHYWYEHSAEGHTLCLSDKSVLAASVDPVDNPDVANDIAFHSKSGSVEADGIHEWQAARRLGSGGMTLSSFDYKNPNPQRTEAASTNQQGDVFPHEVHRDLGSYGFTGWEDGAALAQRSMEAHDCHAQYFAARSNDRTVQPGRAFTLTGHFSADPRAPQDGEEARRSIADRPYLIVVVEHEASNNYLAGAGGPSHYQNRFECIDKNIRWRPGIHYNSAPCVNPGIQTAIVVGPEGESIYTDAYGRVKIQFHWDRTGKRDESSSAWVRVASSWAGGELGVIAVPRIGTEVLVHWLNGNPDHPIITGSVYNDAKKQPWELATQRALSGLRSRELTPDGGNRAGGRSNHLLLDDSNGAIQAQLRSDHLHSQLSLGHITRIEDNAGRQDSRGEGFELRSDGVGVVRAAEGLLLTSEPRPHAAAHITDMGETVQRLTQARAAHENLAGLAQQHQAQDKNGDQSEVAMSLKSQNDAIKGSKRDDGFPELIEPQLLLSSPCGIAATAATSTHFASGEHIALSAGAHVSIAAGKSLYASVAHKFSLFVHQLGMKLIAASGKVEIHAQTDDMELLAQKVLEIISTTGWINLKAKEGIRLNGGGTELVLSAEGIKGYTTGKHEMYAADHQTFPGQKRLIQFAGEIPHHEVCIPCMLLAAKAHVPLVEEQ
jgi:type VI secretion system secreted protein VgrG